MRGPCLLWAEWGPGGTGGHALYIRVVVGAVYLHRIGCEGPGPVWAELQIFQVRGQTSRLLCESSWLFQVLAVLG